MKKLSTIVLILFLASAAVFAQKTVNGTITDASGVPLIGANVIVKGTSTGTITDIDGNYSLTVPEGYSILEVSYTGFTDSEINIANGDSMSISLSEGTILDELIVVGYSTQRRKDITGSVSAVDVASIQNVQLPSIESALQGRAAGVTVNKNSGTPGGGIDVNIRGRTSISASNQPLYVIDGIPIISGDNTDFTQEGVGNGNISVLADINPEEIESIEVLKDASSAAIYGSRAANGVVLITTKSGKAGATKISLNASHGNQWAPKTIDVVDGPQYIEYITEVFGANIVGTEANNNWQDLIFRTSTLSDYNANISGGTEKTTFFSSLGYKEDNGIIRNSGFDRYSGRLNVKHLASDKLTFNVNLGYTNSNTQQVQNDNNIFGAVSTSILLPPVVPIMNEDGSWGTAFGLENPVAAVTDYRNNVKRGRTQGRFGATYSIFDGLSFSAALSADLLNSSESIFEPSTLQSSNTGRAVEATITNNRFIHEYVFNYDKRVGNGSLRALAGTSFQQDNINSTFTEAVDFPTDEFTGLSSGAVPVTTNGGFTGDNLRSYFGSVNYSFDNKYFFTGTFRADGSSRFINNQWGYFPGASVGINIAEVAGIGGFDQLKVRVGWGKTGNNVIDNFLSRQLFGGGANYLDQPGTVPTQIGNPDLKWETTTQTNIGLDFAIIGSKLSGSVDLYTKNTDDLLLDRPIPTTSGFTTVVQNVGEVRNRGIDVALTTENFNRKNFYWSTTFTLGYLQNEVVRLVDGIPFDAGFANRVAEGQPLGSFFGHQTDGLFQNQAEIEAAAAQPNAAPGDIRFMDISGGAGEDGIVGTADDLDPDGVINDNDRTYIGKALPDFTGGLMNSINIYGFEVNAFFQFATGFQIYNNNLAFAEGLNSVFAPTVNAWENRWQQEGDQTDVPRLVRNDPNGNRRDSDRLVEDGDYIRLKTLTVGYNLPGSMLDNIGLDRVKIYASGYNLWTATGYSWYDPEVNTFDGNNTALGTDFLTFPQPRSIVFGVNIGF
jgi:TonB-linked SusC/RagA family outer membrane protein